MKITCKLLGVPEIIKNKKKVQFPYSKINAFLYYMAVEKTVSRNEISGLLWPMDSEKIGKKNLRNVLYHTKKILHPDIVLSPNNTILQLNEELDIYIDVDDFQKDTREKLDLYDGEFLKSFYIKDLDEFDQWIYNSRINYHQIYYSSLYEKIKDNLYNGLYDNLEGGINRLISLDNLDEKNYRLLMDYYLKIGRNNKVIEIYGELSELLRKELNVDPDEETKKLYLETIEKFNPKDELLEKEVIYFGREKEISTIINTTNKFLDGDSVNTIFVEGEIGVGKSTLFNRVFFDLKEDFKIFSFRCFQLESPRTYRIIEVLIQEMEKNKDYKEYSGKIEDLANKIQEIQKLQRFDDDDGFLKSEVEDSFIKLLEKLGEITPIIIHLDDIHWMDLSSLKLLTKSVLINKNILYFFSGRSGGNFEIEDFLSTLSYYDKIKRIELHRFSKEESMQYLKKAIPEIKDKSIYEEVYNNSEGVPVFLWEYVKLIKAKKPIDKITIEMENSIKSRLSFLSKEHREILEVLSIFRNEFPINIVSELFDMSEKDIMEFLDSMVKRGLLKEFMFRGEISYKFNHKKVREFLYYANSKAKRKYYHYEIAKILEKMKSTEEASLERNIALAYHFKEAGRYVEELEYNIEILNYYLNFAHELFPVLGLRGDNIDNQMRISQEEAIRMLKELKEDLDKFKDSENYESIQYLDLKLSYMRGRYLIRGGNYEDGLEEIKYVIKRSIILEENDYEINGYKQMIFYNIQRNNPQEMIKYIDKALELAVKCNYHLEIGMFLRLKGLYYLMVGDYEVSEGFLKESIHSFSITESIADIYAINIAAGHNYIGELKFAQKNYEESIEELKKSIKLSDGKQAFSSLIVFYINIGKVYFAKNDMENAKKYFDLAVQLNNDFDSYWKVPVLDAYMALTQLRLGELQTSKLYLKNAIKHSDKMNDPRDLGTVNFALYVIYKGLNEKEKEIYFKDVLIENEETYKKIALENLDRFRDVYEIDICEGRDEILLRN